MLFLHVACGTPTTSKATEMKQFLRRLKRSLIPAYPKPVKYWRKRYSKFGESLTGPGCVDLGDEANQTDYDTKWAHIRAALLNAGAPRGKSLLDAGCGLGAFTERFVLLGYSVSAVDFAQNAVEIAKRRIGDAVKWYVHGLVDFAPGQTFEVVVSIDVLFHITDDGLHQRAVSNLASLAVPTGVLLIQDHLVPESDVVLTYSPTASHVRWRSLERYRSILEPEWQLTSHDHYELPMEQNTKDLLVFSRRGSITR
jgi:SAM-dependent methyltransferase